MTLSSRIQIGVSGCLLGQAVRYDGGHKHHHYLTRSLARRFELVPVCPEVGIGMGVPRPPIRLVGRVAAPRALGREDPSLDVTAKLAAYGRQQARLLAGLSGYIFKSRSPSCGLKKVPVYSGARVADGRGLYADAFMSRHPWLPAEEESVLDDPNACELFLQRVAAYRAWQELIAGGLTGVRLRQFHAAHVSLLAARGAKALARVAAGAGSGRVKKIVAEKYLAGFMTALMDDHADR